MTLAATEVTTSVSTAVPRSRELKGTSPYHPTEPIATHIANGGCGAGRADPNAKLE